MAAIADRFEKAIGAVVQRVGNSAREMAGLSEQLADGVERTKQRSASAADASQGAATNVQTVAAAVEELTTTVQEISRQVATDIMIIEDEPLIAMDLEPKDELCWVKHCPEKADVMVVTPLRREPPGSQLRSRE